MSNDFQKLRTVELERLDVEQFKTADKKPFAFVLDDVRSALNVGSIFRTADAFAAIEVILCGITATPPHREILKTALGSTESVAWRHFPSIAECMQTLQQEGYKIWAIEQAKGSISLENADFINTEKHALILGNEVDGVSETALSFADGCIEIPQFGTKHSLNVAVSAGIVAWGLIMSYEL
jgi:23S rRNA (guanosine2251-2'-O)-methyltransferase